MVIARTVQESPPNATHWTRSLMAEAVGISPSSVGRIWAEAGLKPHVSRGFKVSNDPLFEEKVMAQGYRPSTLSGQVQWARTFVNVVGEAPASFGIPKAS